jgi:diphthine-ammonia ligase
MSAALLWSGGKDSLLALDRAQRGGLDVTHLATLFDEASGRVRFHGIKTDLIGAQARLLGKTLITQGTGPTTFESAFTDLLRQLGELGLRDLVFGNIHLADVRAWYEERTVAHGFRHHEPLWGDDPAALVEEFIARGHRSMITSVYLAHGGRPEWLGREFTPQFLDELKAAGIDVCGERGEYHSFSVAGPLFSDAVPVRAAGQFESEGHLILDLDEDS